MGLGASHPHSFQFLPVIIAVSFDPFSVTLCSPSWYDFSLLCPPLLFPPQQTTEMRNPRYWWTGRMLKTSKQTKNKQTKTKKKTLYWAFRTLAFLFFAAVLPVEVPEPWFAMQQLQQQAASDLCDPQRGVYGPGCLWRIQINLLHVLNPVPSTHYRSHSLTRRRWWCWINLPFHIFSENVHGCWCMVRKIDHFDAM